MTEILQPPQEDTFLSWLMLMQLQFEQERVGTDGSLYEVNTIEHGIVRGVIGEAQEALEALKNGDIEAVKMELVDTIIFLGSVLMHAGMKPLEIVEMVSQKMQSNHQKYRTDHFSGRTVRDALAYSKQNWVKY